MKAKQKTKAVARPIRAGKGVKPAKAIKRAVKPSASVAATPLPLGMVPVDKIVEGDNLRYYHDDDAQSLELAESIRKDGLIEPLVVTPVDGKFKLIAGYRRLREIKRTRCIREVPVYIRPVAAEDDLLRLNAAENIKRRNFSHMEFAIACETIRKRKGWTGGENTKHVAEFFGVSEANVTQHEKLLVLNDKERRKVHDGELSHAAALKLTEIEDQGIRSKLLEKAEQIQERKEAARTPVPRSKARMKAAEEKKRKAPARRIEAATVEHAKREVAKEHPELRKTLAKEPPENGVRTIKELFGVLAVFEGNGDRCEELLTTLEDWADYKLDDEKLLLWCVQSLSVSSAVVESDAA